LTSLRSCSADAKPLGYLRGLDLGSLDPNRQLGSLGFAGRREVVTRRRPGVRPALQAMDDDEGHTINDELRMMGLEGDDEDGMEEEREELFGRRGNVEVIMPPPPPVGVGVGGAGAGADAGVGAGAGAGADTGAGGAGGAADGAAPDSVSHAGEKRGRPCTSKVWDEYEKLLSMVRPSGMEPSAFTANPSFLAFPVAALAILVGIF